MKKPNGWKLMCEAYWEVFGPKKNDCTILRMYQAGKQHRYKPFLEKRRILKQGISLTGPEIALP